MGARFPPNEDKVRVTVTAPPTAVDGPLTLDLEGKATIAGRVVARPGVPADEMMQAFAYQHLVPAREWKISVSDRSIARSAATILDATPVQIPVGGTVGIRIGTPSRAYMDRFNFELNEPPEGIVLNGVSPCDDGMELVLRCQAGKTRPGLRGNLIVDLVPGPDSGAAQNGKRPANQRRVPVGTLPAIPFVIVR